MGFGNLINAGILAEKKLKKVHHDEKKDKHEEKNAFTDVGKSEVTGKPKTNLVRQDFLSLHWTKPKINSKLKKQFMKVKPVMIHSRRLKPSSFTIIKRSYFKEKLFGRWQCFGCCNFSSLTIN